MGVYYTGFSFCAGFGCQGGIFTCSKPLFIPDFEQIEIDKKKVYAIRNKKQFGHEMREKEIFIVGSEHVNTPLRQPNPE